MEFRVWAPDGGAGRRARARGGDHALEPVGDGVFAGEVAADAGRRLPLRARRRARAARPVLALPARGHPRPVAGRRHPALRDRRRGRTCARGARALRAARRHVHARGHVRRRDPAPAAAARARRDGDRADAGGDVPRRTRLGLRRRLHLRAALRPTAGPRALRASSTPRIAKGSASSSTSSTTTSARGRRRSARSGRTSPTRTTRSGATRSTTRSAACASGRSATRELWTRDYAIDGLRLDAVHAIYDDSPVHVLRELRERVDRARDERDGAATTSVRSRSGGTMRCGSTTCTTSCTSC